MATDMPLTKEDDEGGVFYRQISGDDNERPEVTEALLARFIEGSHTKSSARHSPDAVAGRIAGLLKVVSTAHRVYRDLEFSAQWQALRQTVGSHATLQAAASSMYDLFLSHMRQELVEKRRRERAFVTPRSIPERAQCNFFLLTSQSSHSHLSLTCTL